MSQPLRRTERPLVKRAPYQYSPPTSKYAPKPGFQHRSTFRTKQELRDEIVTLKGRVSDLESRLSEALKKNTALKKKLDHTLDSRKRKGEDIESQHQKKKKPNVDLQILERTAVDKVARKTTVSILKRKGEDLQVPQQKTKKLDFDLQSLKRKAVDNGEDGPPQKYRIYKSKNDLKKTASNVSLQTRLDDIVTKVTMPDNQDGPSNEDSIWIPLMDDDDEDAPSQGIAVPEPTTATQQTIAERQLAELTAPRKRSKGLKDKVSSKKTTKRHENIQTNSNVNETQIDYHNPILSLASKFKDNPVEVLNAIGTLMAESSTK